MVQPRMEQEAKYWELLEGDRCRLVVIGVETGGRFSPKPVNFVDALAAAEARDSPPVLRRSAHLAWRRQWMRMLAVSCGRSFAASLVAGPSDVVWHGQLRTRFGRPFLGEVRGCTLARTVSLLSCFQRFFLAKKKKNTVRRPVEVLLCLLPFAFCLLPFAFCLLPFAFCLLPFVCCSLPYLLFAVFLFVDVKQCDDTIFSSRFEPEDCMRTFSQSEHTSAVNQTICGSLEGTSTCSWKCV